MTRWWALVFLSPLLALAEDGLQPSRPTLQHVPSVSALSTLHGEPVDIQLADAIALALRDNRAVRGLP